MKMEMPAEPRPAQSLSVPPDPTYISLPLPIGWIDPNAAKVVRRLHTFEHPTYLVGGCVRDLLVGRHPKDFDVATGAMPRDVKRAFTNCRLIGRRFRLAHVLFRDTIIEVATFRRDPNAEEGADEESSVAEASEDGDLLIRDDNNFGTAADDAFRRDFTINALYYDLSTSRVIDYVGGFSDIEARVVRTIGDPVRRFQEDPIRMLRAVKFSSTLGFDIEARTWAALVEVAPSLTRAAVPRIQEELFKLLRSGFSGRSFQLLLEGGLLRLMLPDHDRILRAELGLPQPATNGAALPAAPPEGPEAQASEEIDGGPESSEDIDGGPPSEDDIDAADGAPSEVIDGEDAGEDAVDLAGRPAEDDEPPLARLPTLHAYLDAFDHLPVPVGNHLYLGILALHPTMERILPGASLPPQEQAVRIAANWLEGMGSTLRLPRRDREMARLAVMGFTRILFKRDRRRLAATMARKSYFPEAAALFGLHVLATGEDIETFRRLAERLDDGEAVRPILAAIDRRYGATRRRTDPEPREGGDSGPGDGPRRRRRRRRGRREE